MMARMRGICLVTAAVTLLVAASAAGCKRSSDREKGVAQEETGRVALEPEKGTLTVTSEAGSISGTGDLPSVPDDFPKTIPLYTGAHVYSAAKSSGPDGRPSWMVTLDTGDAKDKVVDFYKANMAGFKLANSMDMGDTSMCVWQGSQYDATLMANVEPDQKTRFTLTASGK
jgi:hypothetical protein